MKMKKKFVAMFLALVMIMGVMVTPASAANINAYVNGTAVVTVNGKRGVSYVSYNDRSYADSHIVTIYADDQNFPVTVKMRYNDSITSDTYTLYSYGTHRLNGCLSGLFKVWNSYLTIEIKPYPASLSTTSEAQTKQPTKDEILDEKLDKLLDELDLGFYNDAGTPYGKELRAFLAGEWDGSSRGYSATRESDYAGYISDREVRQRTYHWDATNLYTGKTYSKSVNVDYIGYKKVIPAPSSTQDFSFAVSYANGEIEEWSLLDQRDAWKLDLTGEHIDKIYPTGSAGSEMRGLVCTLDADGQEHIYSLHAGGEVVKLT